MDNASTTQVFSSIDSIDGHRKKRRRSIFRNSRCLAITSTSSSGDADVSTLEDEDDLTPGSLEVWIDLPDEIKYDPALANFKKLYERSHGKPDQDPDVGITVGGGLFKRTAELAPIGEVKEKEGKDAEETFLNNSDDEKAPKSAKKKQFDKIMRMIKLGALVAAWLVLTVSLLLNNEKEDIVLHTAVKISEITAYDLEQGNDRVRIQVTLNGPFLQATSSNASLTANTLNIWLHRSVLVNGTEKGIGQNSTYWSIPLQPDEILDFSPSSTVSQVLVLPANLFTKISSSKLDARVLNEAETMPDVVIEGANDAANNQSERNVKEEIQVTLRMHTTTHKTVPITVSYLLNPLDQQAGIIYSTILLLGLYILIIFEVVNRTLAALLVSSLGIAILAISGARPTLPDLMGWLDVETLLLLFSMMLLVAILAETGLFDYLAVLAFELTGGRTWPLINCLCFFTAIFSTFLDNVTTVLLMTPVTIRLCEVMQLNPIPVLMCMVIFSSVGGAATPVGDPPNVIIASHPSIINEGINFANFALHMGVGIIFVSIQTYLQLRYMFKDMNKLRHTVPQDIIELRQEMLVWRRAAASLSSYSRDEDLVRKALERKVDKLSNQLRRRETGGGAKVDPTFTTTLADMKEKYYIRDKPLLIKSTICVSFVVVVFFLHAIPELQSLSLGWTALLGALLLLLLAEREDLEPILARVEWSTLLFFAALFVLMEALSKLGLIAWIGSLVENIILSVNKESQLTVALLLVLWVSGVVSAFVDNIPLTTMMVRVTAALSDPAGLGLPLQPLAWALSFGACLGGNGTLIGASANVVCAGVAEQHGYKITFLQFLKIGFPIMIGNLIVASIYLLLCHVVFTWH